MERGSRPAVVSCVPFSTVSAPDALLSLLHVHPQYLVSMILLFGLQSTGGGYNGWTCFATGKQSNVCALKSGTFAMMAFGRIFEVGMEV